jgi:uncharacterized membrane protein
MAANPVSTANVGNHPLHPMLIPFPIALLVGAFVTDLAFWGTGAAFWASASAWLLGAGIVMALLAATAGFIDFFGEPRIRALSDAWYHMAGNLAAVVLAIGNLALRLGQGADTAVLPWGVLLSFIVVCILVFTGWLGGEMVYRHRVAVFDAPEQTAAGRPSGPRRAA